jgi:SAM-dependent methyltransferase
MLHQAAPEVSDVGVPDASPPPPTVPDLAAPDPEPEPTEFQRVADRTILPQPEPEHGIATESLFARLTADDVAMIEASLDRKEKLRWAEASPLHRKRLALAFGLHHGVPGVAERTGLTAAMPPEGVHLMGRGLIDQIGGSYYFADFVLEFLESVGRPLESGAHVLDYSCSSGRVIRALAAARPDVRCHGCDPNDGAITWARQAIPGVNFFTADTSPPLGFERGYFDVVFAISVWSHYSAAAALRWLEEMHRVIKPGGHLILTTHGVHSSVWFSYYRDPAIEMRLGPQWTVATAYRLQQDGHAFWDVFGPEGDYGVIDSDWGLAFFTPEWLAEHVTPDWALVKYRIGRADGNQDAFALQRR